MRAMYRFYSVFIGFSTRALFIIQDPVQDPVQHAVAMASSLLQSVALFQCHRPAHPPPPSLLWPEHFWRLLVICFVEHLAYQGLSDDLFEVGGSYYKESACNAGDLGPIPWRREWLFTPVFLPGESHGQRSLAGYSPWGHKESDVTWATNTFTEMRSLRYMMSHISGGGTDHFWYDDIC